MTHNDSTKQSMDILAAIFFFVAGTWLIIAMGYSCMIVLFLRLRSRGQLDSIYEAEFGRIYLGCGSRFYIPTGWILRRYMHHLQQEQLAQSQSPRTAAGYMTTEERRSAMEVLLWDERVKVKTVCAKSCTSTSPSLVAAVPVPEESSGSAEESPASANASDLEGPMCLICLDEFTEPDCVLHSQTCSHDYHKDCIMDWLQRNGTRECPCCRVAMIAEEQVWATVQRLREEQRTKLRREKKWWFQRLATRKQEGSSQGETEHYESGSDDDDAIMVSPTLSLDASIEEGQTDSPADANV